MADDPALEWPEQVLANVQSFAISSGYYIERMMSRFHSYHLDDAPDLRSCNLLLRSLSAEKKITIHRSISDPDRLRNFYGKNSLPDVRYVRESTGVDYGKAHKDEYYFQPMEDSNVTDNRAR